MQCCGSGRGPGSFSDHADMTGVHVGGGGDGRRNLGRGDRAASGARDDASPQRALLGAQVEKRRRTRPRSFSFVRVRRPHAPCLWARPI